MNITPDTTTAVTGAVSVAATLISTFFIEKVGRRPLLIYGSLGMMTSLIVVGAVIMSTYDAAGVPTLQAPQTAAVTVFICFYIVHFSYSYG